MQDGLDLDAEQIYTAPYFHQVKLREQAMQSKINSKIKTTIVLVAIVNLTAYFAAIAFAGGYHGG